MARITLDDSRRLTGPNLYWDRPAAILDVHLEGIDAGQVVDAWRGRVRALAEAVGWRGEPTTEHVFDGGASLLLAAPIDVLYAACELNELALALAAADLGQGDAPDLDAELSRIRAQIEDERQPALLALQAEAAKRGAPFLWDDDAVSVGYGVHAVTWAAGELPAVERVDWDAAKAVPVGLVTGTNGKSTTVRMAAAIMAAAGTRCGITSTDFIRVGDEVLDRGDYSGPGGARSLLRHRSVECAVLEVARGGLLRRGLGVERANAALITNVAADHLGEYGINTVRDLLPAKFVVHRALHGDAPLILNADDAGVVAHAASLDVPVTWFALKAGHPVIRNAIGAGGSAYATVDGVLCRVSAGGEQALVAAADIPATFGGAAAYNVRNALGAAALATVLGANDEAIAEGLRSFHSDSVDNPGRGNLFEHRGVRILVDFAHNEHGVRALADTVNAMGAERHLLLMGQAGDRPDRDIRQLTRAALDIGPARLMVCELPGYERGRAPMQVPGVIRAAALDAGLDEAAIELHPDPVHGVDSALAQACEGDLLVLLALTQRDEVLERIRAFVESEESREH